MKKSIIPITILAIIILNFIVLIFSKYSIFLYYFRIVTHLLTIISLIYIIAHYFLPTYLYNTSIKSIILNSNMVIKSGDALSAITCGGQLKGINFNGPLIQVSLYPKGILVKPILMPAFSVQYDDIVRIESCKFVLTNGVKIHHTSEIISSPIILFVAKDDAFIKKIHSLSVDK